MIKKIDILGIQLDNHTVREAIRQVETYLSNDVLNTIEKVSMKMLLAAETDPVVREAISSMDLTVIGEEEIIKVAGVATMQRVQETKANDFAYEFFKRVERNKKSLFLLGETEEKLVQVKEELQKTFPKLIFAGEYALEKCVGDLEAVINDMNVTTPDVILSVLPSPQQEHFLMEHKDKMNANIWYGAGESGMQKKKHRSIGNILQSKMHLERLKNSIDKYEKDSEAESEEKKENEA